MKLTIALSILLLPLASSAADASSAIQAIHAVDREGKGNEAAAAAWASLAQSSSAELPALLAGMNGANPLAENWMRAAISVVADRAHAAKEMPVAALKAFLLDTKNAPNARVAAFDLIQRSDPALAAEVTPMLIEDPSSDLRRHPVAKLIEKGDAAKESGDESAAVSAWREALQGARDEDQIKILAKNLRAAKQEVNLPKHFGFLMNWQLIAPFTNVDRKGFDTVFPPEEKVELSASYPGKGSDAKWQAFTSTDDYGMIDFNKPFTMLKEVTGYAYTEFNATEERDAELRLGCKNGWKVWLNGEMLFGRDEYHRGMKLDQYKLPIHLKKGKNSILIKCCQNEQTEQWTVEWQFQIRVCDATGTAILPAE